MALIDHQEELDLLCELIEQSSIIALDTEFIRTKTYYPDLSLVQIGFEDSYFAVDTFAKLDFTHFSRLLANPNILKIIHSAEQDIQAINRFFNIEITNIYDTQLAALICGYGESVSYRNLVKDICDKDLSKKQQFSNWEVRPLSDVQLVYALNDVKYSMNIYHELEQRLEILGRTEWFREDSNITYTLPDEYLWIKFKKSSNHIEEFVLIKAILKLRQKYAMEHNIAPNHLIKNIDITKLAHKGNLLNLKLENLEEYIQKEEFYNYLVNNFDYQAELTEEVAQKFQNTKNYIKHAKLSNLIKEIASHFADKYGLPESYFISRDETFAHICQIPYNIRFYQGFRKEMFGDFISKL
ncbi:ribonuclease D [Rickettsiales endosymbiont of Stachyamoeba lipophora]|uniref:ribonuclease D n=1 Tax=Rickettsiales endosymbiont of Stachyamoeba lipophora TaxID=2486578 RepID=UPI000F6538B2|nr:hypothetical protein [Rickettsiales endosymbiont of Stachyamoeba lipophora]AZL15596.1 hypothetical protein EF513_03405 [Rickettsiales endosymbiont of Stachyamoeba lipophora]